MSLLSTYSQLYDEKTFYHAFLKDLESCRKEIYIESPFITSERTKLLVPIFKKTLNRGVKICIMTRNPKDHSESFKIQSEDEITNFEVLGIQVLLCVGNHHRKLAILDREILWEGSLNILSQTYSREIMRRIENPELTMQMFNFLNLDNFL